MMTIQVLDNGIRVIYERYVIAYTQKFIIYCDDYDELVREF